MLLFGNHTICISLWSLVNSFLNAFKFLFLKLNTSSFYVIYLGFGTGVKLHNKHSFMYSFFCFSPFRPCTDYSERERRSAEKLLKQGMVGGVFTQLPLLCDHFALAPNCMWPEWRKSSKYGRVQTVLYDYIQSIVNLEWQVLTWEFLGFVTLHNSACYFSGPLGSCNKHFKTLSIFFKMLHQPIAKSHIFGH